jgi:hypothetical protein
LIVVSMLLFARLMQRLSDLRITNVLHVGDIRQAPNRTTDLRARPAQRLGH